MRTSCLKLIRTQHESFFNGKRLVFKVTSTTAESPKSKVEAQEAKQTDTETLAQKYKKKEVQKKLQNPVTIKPDIQTTMQELANIIGGKDTEKTKQQLFSALINSWEKKYPEEKLEKTWVKLSLLNCTITIAEKNGGLVFEIKDPEKREIILPISGIPINVDTAPKAPRKTAQIRKIDQKSEEKEATKAKKERQEKRVHSIVFQNEEDVSGTLHVPTDQKERNKIGTVFINLEKIYPNARKGDRVSITAYDGESHRVAIFDGEKFVYEKPDSLKKQPVKVRWNYKLQFTPDENARDAEKPRAPKNTPVAGYFRVKEDMPWNEIAQKVMSTTDVPEGRDIKSNPSSGQHRNSPAAILNKLGYSAENAQDVAAYAKLLSEGNNQEKLYVWAVIPKMGNPRLAREKQVAEKTKYQNEAIKRTKGREKNKTAEYNTIMAKHFKDMYENKNYKINTTLIDIVNNDKLWNYYWEEGNLEGIKQIRDGFKLLGVQMGKQRSVILDAIQQGSNKTIDFEDLLDAFDNKDLNIYMTRNKKRGNYSDFKDEFLFYQVATKIKKGQVVDTDTKEWYADNYKEYVTEAGIVDVEVKYHYLVNLIKGSALILDGLQNLQPSVSVEHAEATLAVKAERKEKNKGKERTPWRAQSKEDIFLQQFFNPLNRKSAEENVQAEEMEEGKSDFQNLSSEESAYRMIRVQSADEKDPTKIDLTKMINVMNSYIRIALVNFFTQKKLLDEKGEGNKSEIQKMSVKYFGTPKLENLNLPTGDQMQEALKVYKINSQLNLGNKAFINNLRNLLQDGFLSERQTANGEIKLGGEIKEVKDWTNYTEILKKAKTPAAKEAVKNLLATQPKFARLPKEELEKAVMNIDEFMSKKHEWQGSNFDHKINNLTVKDNRLIDINAAVDTNTGDWYLGLSKQILKIPGIDAGLSLGVAVNPKTGEVVIGAIVAKEMNISKQWSASVKGAAGVEVTRPALTAGTEVGFTWMSKGTENSAWRDKVDFGVGAGTSMSFNLTDIYLGPYTYVGYGQKKDFSEQASKLYTNTYLNNRLDMVDKAKTPNEKVAAMLKLPRGIGEFMTTIKYNLNWSDDQMVKFYETQVKGNLKNMSLNKAMESASGISEAGIGVTLDPLSLTIMAIAVASGNPAIISAATIGIFGKLGIIVGSSIKVQRKLSDLSPAQIAYEQKVCAEINKMFPEIEISYEILRFSNMENVNSRNFAGSNLQRIMGLPQNINPQNVEQSEVHPEKTDNFKKLQEQFAKNKLLLGYDEKEKKYTITPAVTETYKLFIDPDIAAGHGLIIKENKILIASKQDLSNLHIRRFDVIYPGYVDGAVQHTLITISDNPYVKLTQLAEQNSYVEGKYDHEHGVTGYPRKVGEQNNIYTFKEYRKNKGKLFNADQLGKSSQMPEKARAKRARHMELTARAFKIPKPLQEKIQLTNLTVSPENFIKKWQYRILYRQLTTNPNPKNIATLEGLIKKENPQIDENQMILYKEKLFHLSMSEGKVSIETRLNWARNAVYLPFFAKKKTENPNIVPEEISAEDLADAFIEAIRFNLKNEAKSLKPGESLFTAVGTFKVNGIRMVEAASGQNSENKFIEGMDYAKFLETKGSHATIEQRTIARLLLQQHSEIPKKNKAFLGSRLAKKLFYLGGKDMPNPIIDILGESTFEKLLAAYDAIENGRDLPLTSTHAIAEFRKIVEQVRKTQLGEGQPVLMDGNRPGRAVIIEGYVFVIETTLKSGLYEFCKNPSVLYNENITVFKLSELQKAKPGLNASVFSGAGDVIALESRHGEVSSIGLKAIGTMTVESELQEEDNGGGGGGGGGSKFRFPPPRKTPPGRRPPPGRPIAKPKGEVNQGEKAPDADAESGGSSE